MLLGAFGFLLTIAFLPGAIGDAVAPRWAMIAAFLPALLFIKVHLTARHLILAALLTWAAAGILFTPVALEWANGFAQLAILAGVFCIGAELKDLRPLWAGLAIGITVNAVIAAFQLGGLSPVDQAVAPAALFANKTFLGEIALVALIGAIGCNLWVLVPGPLFAVAVTTCREVYIALAVAVGVAVWRWSRLTALVGALALVVGGFVVAAHAAELRESASNRMAIIGDTVAQLTVLGHGVGTYYVAVSEHAIRLPALGIRADHVHNDLLEAIFELGIGVFLLVALVGCALAGGLALERTVLIAILVEGLLGFPLHLPATAFVAALVAGRLCGVGAGVRRRVDRGRTLDPVRQPSPWAGVLSPRAVAAGGGDLSAQRPYSRAKRVCAHALERLSAAWGRHRRDRPRAGERPVGLGPAVQPGRAGLAHQGS